MAGRQRIAIKERHAACYCGAGDRLCAGAKGHETRVQGKRVEGIDFWRGAALAVILVNHIPGNVLGAITPRNFGFSDAAEGFVFLSGVSIALAYGDKFRRSVVDATAALSGRVLRLYGVHLALTATALALYGVATYVTPWDFLGSESSRAAPFADPAKGVISILALSHQIAYFNILPLYIALIALAPALFACGLSGGPLMLAASASLYAARACWESMFPHGRSPAIGISTHSPGSSCSLWESIAAGRSKPEACPFMASPIDWRSPSPSVRR